jgi:hypothetical protein
MNQRQDHWFQPSKLILTLTLSIIVDLLKVETVILFFLQFIRLILCILFFKGFLITLDQVTAFLMSFIEITDAMPQEWWKELPKFRITSVKCL